MNRVLSVQDSGRTEAAERAALRTTRDLLIEIEPVTPAVENRDVFAIFESETDLIGLPVVEDGRPIGLINRNIFMQSLARPFHREIYWHKSCIAFMDKTPFVAEIALSIEELSLRIVESGTKTLMDGFIIAEQGRYRGIGLAQDMLRAMAFLQAERNRIVMESIDYGSVIQRSLSRASRQAMRRSLPDHFLLWEPRDVVSGDFYFFQDYPDGFLFGLYDCTGHGVPGAFMTLIMSSFLQGSIREETRRDPGRLLGEINRRVKSAMDQIDHQHSDSTEHHSDDGMDAAFCWYDRHSRRLTYAGAQLQLFMLAPGEDEVRILSGERHGVGYATTSMDQIWTNHVRELEEGAAVYLFTDGLLDQLGGERRIAFGKRRLCATLLAHRDAPMSTQRAALFEALLGYQGAEPRKDDISAFGFRATGDLGA
ncbi:MAG: SpoIIE family protein phosphatase [Rhodocyclaceae bacterium]|nr:SpoIIE family protein phosphatase [Rhodocyclaceae bacterium]